MALIKSVNLNWYNHLIFKGGMDFSPGVNLLIGRNGSGKTSVLRMIHGLKNHNEVGLDSYALQSFNVGDELVNIAFEGDEGEKHNATFRRSQGNENVGAWEGWQGLEKVVRFVTSDRKVTTSAAAANPIVRPDVNIAEPSEAEVDISQQFIQTIIKDLVSHISDYAKKTPIASQVTEEYREALVDFEKEIVIDLERPQDIVFFRDHLDREISINDLSSGEKEFLYFYAFLRSLRAEKGKIVLIDEPELHLHSSQLSKLCELIDILGENNQVIIATHSGEILQHFINANVILLHRGQVQRIASDSDLRDALEAVGLPIDPSVFTAHWICAENNPRKRLGAGGPTTPELLGWVFGQDLSRRYWSFGHSYENAEAVIEGIQSVSTRSTPVQMTAILDGDRLIASSDQYPPDTQNASDDNVRYWPFWELENILLVPEAINELLVAANGLSGEGQMWQLVEESKEVLFESVLRTVVRQAANQHSFSRKLRTEKNAMTALSRWTDDVRAVSFDRDALRAKFDKVVADRDWRWVPGKEVVQLIGKKHGNFWTKVRQLGEQGRLQELLRKRKDISSLVDEARA